jgi:hypothetical protein
MSFYSFFSVLFYIFLCSWLYLVFLAFIVFAVLRRIGCRRLAGAFFGSGFVKKESVGNRFGVAVFVYVLLLPLSAVLLSFPLLGSFSFAKVFVLFSLLAVAAYSLTTLYSRSTVT